jgi:hypothetical protein
VGCVSDPCRRVHPLRMRPQQRRQELPDPAAAAVVVVVMVRLGTVAGGRAAAGRRRCCCAIAAAERHFQAGEAEQEAGRFVHVVRAPRSSSVEFVVVRIVRWGHRGRGACSCCPARYVSYENQQQARERLVSETVRQRMNDLSTPDRRRRCLLSMLRTSVEGQDGYG